ncbi:MAG TPA: acyl-CoA dehydrogenase family protein [Stellaceae bacterium]|nr:acyl-CoA dehydrogenase family protein [Stellaceae bacterium]
MNDRVITAPRSAAKPAARPSREELLERAAALVPVLRERAATAEALRHCPAETVADLHARGLLRICQPARYGGYEHGWDVLCEVSQVLARGCASQAWVGNIYNDHSQMLGMFDIRAQDDVWGDNPDARLSAAIEPVGKARPVAGGVVYSGRHRYSSGIDHVHWVLCGGHMHEDGKAPRRCFFLVPKAAATVIDDWHVIGLAGTGSKSFAVEDLFVPAHRILDGDASDEGTGPGTDVNTAPVFRIPRHDIAGTGFAAIAVGVAEGFIEEYLAYTRTRTSRGEAVAQLMGTQIGLGHAAIEVRAAQQICIDGARQAMAVLARGERLSRRQRQHTRLASSYAAQLALAAVQRLFNAAGGRALFTDNAMQRLMRDLYAVAAHRGLAWDAAAAGYGAILLGSDGAAP